MFYFIALGTLCGAIMIMTLIIRISKEYRGIWRKCKGEIDLDYKKEQNMILKGLIIMLISFSTLEIVILGLFYQALEMCLHS